MIHEVTSQTESCTAFPVVSDSFEWEIERFGERLVEGNLNSAAFCLANNKHLQFNLQVHPVDHNDQLAVYLNLASHFST